MARVCRSFATEGSGASAMKLSLCTPHETIYHDKVIDKVILPGEQGEYGVTVGHSPIISQLKIQIRLSLIVRINKQSFKKITT